MSWRLETPVAILSLLSSLLNNSAHSPHSLSPPRRRHSHHLAATHVWTNLTENREKCSTEQIRAPQETLVWTRRHVCVYREKDKPKARALFISDEAIFANSSIPLALYLSF